MAQSLDEITSLLTSPFARMQAAGEAPLPGQVPADGDDQPAEPANLANVLPVGPNVESNLPDPGPATSRRSSRLSDAGEFVMRVRKSLLEDGESLHPLVAHAPDVVLSDLVPDCFFWILGRKWAHGGPGVVSRYGTRFYAKLTYGELGSSHERLIQTDIHVKISDATSQT